MEFLETTKFVMELVTFDSVLLEIFIIGVDYRKQNLIKVLREVKIDPYYERKALLWFVCSWKFIVAFLVENCLLYQFKSIGSALRSACTLDF